MLSLVELQKQFVDGLNEENNAILSSIQLSKNLSQSDQLNIYRNSLIGSLQKTLKETYPVCEKLVGNAFFLNMIDQYISFHKSSSFDLGKYGEHFSEFIATYTPANTLVYLSDVAKLEWAWHQLFTVRDSEAFDLQKFTENVASLKEEIIFALPYGSSLLTSPYPIHKIWEVNQNNFYGDQTVILEEKTQFFYFIWRKSFETRIDLTTHAEWRVLQWIQQELSLASIINQFILEFPEETPNNIIENIIGREWLFYSYPLASGSK